MSFNIGDVGTTELNLWGIGVPRYSARGLSQTLEPIDDHEQIERTIDGGLIDMSSDELRKYKSTITGSDQQPPAVDGVWAGREVTVDCIAELACDQYAILGRTPVEGSQRDSHGFTIYRPRLVMWVFRFSLERDEYGVQISWKMELEEF